MAVKPPVLHIQTATNLSAAIPKNVPRVVTVLRGDGTTSTMGFANADNMTAWLSQQVNIDEITGVR